MAQHNIIVCASAHSCGKRLPHAGSKQLLNNLDPMKKTYDIEPFLRILHPYNTML